MKTGKDEQARFCIGISRCLLGEAVRFDGGHKRDAYLMRVLGPKVRWVPVCPELEAGLGVPREPITLAGAVSNPRVLGKETGRDYTPKLLRFTRRRLRQLANKGLDGFVFKAKSPSCSLDDWKLRVPRSRRRIRSGGIFASAFQAAFPLVPVIDEKRLQWEAERKCFIRGMFSARRARQTAGVRKTRGRA